RGTERGPCRAQAAQGQLLCRGRAPGAGKEKPVGLGRVGGVETTRCQLFRAGVQVYFLAEEELGQPCAKTFSSRTHLLLRAFETSRLSAYGLRALDRQYHQIATGEGDEVYGLSR